MEHILTKNLYVISEREYGLLLGKLNLLKSKSFEDLFFYGRNKYNSDISYEEIMTIANDVRVLEAIEHAKEVNTDSPVQKCIMVL